MHGGLSVRVSFSFFSLSVSLSFSVFLYPPSLFFLSIFPFFPLLLCFLLFSFSNLSPCFFVSLFQAEMNTNRLKAQGSMMCAVACASTPKITVVIGGCHGGDSYAMVSSTMYWMSSEYNILVITHITIAGKQFFKPFNCPRHTSKFKLPFRTPVTSLGM